MKSLILLAFVGFVSCAIDFSTIRPVTEILEWQEAFPEFVSNVHSNYMTSDTPPRAGRVISGNRVGPFEMPYQVGVMIHFPSGNGWCGGSLVSRNFVLSAANCFPNTPRATVLLGIYDITVMSGLIPTSSVILHPHFRGSNFRDDIALLHLSFSVFFSNHVKPIRLPNLRQSGASFNNHLSSFGGWGRTTMVFLN